MARVQLGESRLKARRLRRRVVTSIFVLFLLLVFVGGLVALSWAPFMRINTVSLSGVRAADKETLEQAVWEELAGGHLYLFAKSNIFLYPQQTIAEKLQNFSTIKTVTVQAEDFRTILVGVVERHPAALWCGDSASSTGCYFLDENGLAYAPAALYSGDAYQKYYGTLEPASADKNVHGQFLSPEQFRLLPALVQSLQKNTKLQVSEVIVKGDNVRVVFANNFALLFGLKDESGGIVERLTLALGAAPFTKNSLTDFDYLDLRFGDKVYYKLKGQ